MRKKQKQTLNAKEAKVDKTKGIKTNTKKEKYRHQSQNNQVNLADEIRNEMSNQDKIRSNIKTTHRKTSRFSNNERGKFQKPNMKMQTLTTMTIVQRR